MSRGFVDGEYEDGEVRGLLLLLGARGTGKTTKAKMLLDSCSGGLIFFDTLSKHRATFSSYVVVSTAEKLTEYLTANRGRRFNVLYQPRSGDLDAHFRAVCQIVRAFGWMIFAVDELDEFCGPRWGDSRMPPELYHLVNYGRHDRVSMIASARGPTSVARGYRRGSELFVFMLDETEDIKFFEKRMGKETAAKIGKLAKFYYLHRTPEGVVTFGGGPR